MFAMLTVPDHLGSDLVCVLAFGAALILLVAFGLKVIDFLWRKLDLEEQVQKGNISAGIVMGSCVIGMCYAVGQVIRSITGS